MPTTDATTVRVIDGVPIAYRGTPEGAAEYFATLPKRAQGTAAPFPGVDEPLKWLDWLPANSGVLPPAHPAPLPRENGQFSFSPAEVFQRHLETFTLRAPARDDELRGMIGTRAHGICLHPLKQHGDTAWFDPYMQAQSGDLVLVELSESVLARIYSRNAHRPEWRAIYGDSPRQKIFGKLLYAAPGGSWWLITHNGAFPLEGNRIVGVCRRIERDCTRRYEPEPMPVLQISPGAATEVSAASDPDILVSLTAPATNHTAQVLWVTATVAAGDFIEVSGSFRLGASFGGGSWHVDAFAMYGNGTSAIAIGEKLVKDAHAYEFASVTGLTTLSAGTYRFGIGVDMYSDGATNLDARFLNATVRVAVIKR